LVAAFQRVTAVIKPPYRDESCRYLCPVLCCAASFALQPLHAFCQVDCALALLEMPS
jgi:hypothetical protein